MPGISPCLRRRRDSADPRWVRSETASLTRSPATARQCTDRSAPGRVGGAPPNVTKLARTRHTFPGSLDRHQGREVGPRKKLSEKEAGGLCRPLARALEPGICLPGGSTGTLREGTSYVLCVDS